MKRIRQLSEQETESLQERIVNEHWMYTKESFGTHIYATWWEIDGVNYVMEYAVTEGDHLPEVWEVEL